MRKVRTVTVVIASVLLVVILYLVAGCATLFKGTSETVDFSTDPSGAEVYINGSLRGTTPINLKLESKKTYTIEFKKDGYEPRTYTITNHVGVGWIVLDVIFGLVPVIVDAATGAWSTFGIEYTELGRIPFNSEKEQNSRKALIHRNLSEFKV